MNRFVVLVLLFLGTAVVADVDELSAGPPALPEGQTSNYVAKRVLLKYPSSFINLTSNAWKLDENADQIVAALRFEPQSIVGQICSLRLIKQDGALEALLVVSAAEGTLQVDLYDSNATKILNKPIVNHQMSLFDQSVALTLNAKSRQLLFRVGSQAEVTYEIGKTLDLSHSELVVTLGGGDQSLIGCVSLVAVSIAGGDPLSEVVTVAQRDIDACPTKDNCSGRDCDAGKCVNPKIGICDCYGTGFTGPNCRRKGQSVRMRNNDDEHSSFLRYTPWAEDRQVSRIAMDFKFGNVEVNEGVLVYGKLESGEIFTVYVVGDNGNVKLGDSKLVDFSLSQKHNGYHNVVLLFDIDNTMYLRVDEQNATVQLTSRPAFEVMQFGSALPSEGVSEVGVTACLKNVYVDYHDVIYLMYNKDSKVTSSPLRPCEDGDEFVFDLDAARLFPPDPVVQLDRGDEFEPEPEDDKLDEGPEPEAALPSKAMLFPLPARKREEEAVPCDKDKSYLCQHDSKCEKTEEDVRCVCKPGYIGNYCQFTTLPRSCAEAHDFHGLIDGATIIDVDGSRGVVPSVADCRQGKTIVINDGSEAVARDSEYKDHSLFAFSYRDFAPKQLANLVLASGHCRQNVTYTCNKAPLRFHDSRTWFHSAVKGHESNKTRQMGPVPDSCGCIDDGCVGGGKCNCDAGGISVDTGILTGTNAGVIEMVALRDDGDVRGTFSLGELQCSGYENEDKPIRFVEKTHFEIASWSGESIYVQVRTSDSDATFLKAVAQDGNEIWRVSLVGGHTVQFIYDNDVTTIHKQVNDSAWHQIRVESIDGEFRFNVDDENKVISIVENSVFNGKLILGGNENGFIGCARSMRINHDSVKLQQIAAEYSNVKLTCEDHCTPMTCQNEATCFIDFVNDIANCRCKFPKVHRGYNCEIDLNANSSVSFYGGFVRNDDVADTLLTNVFFSFRTDQPHALLFLAHDNNNNFIMVHLSEEVNVTLTLNNEDVVSTCLVTAKRGEEFGDMNWRQVSITHTEYSSILRVDDRVCAIDEPRRLAIEPVNRFLNVHSDIVALPVGYSTAKASDPFQYVFIGGVSHGGKAEDGTFEMSARYESSIPNLLGCVRGFVVADQFIDLRTKGKRPADPSLVRVGCEVVCESVNCHNGGHCSVGWLNNDPSAQKSTCDCSRTSYAGPSCTVDDGIRVQSGGWLNFNVGRELSRLIIQNSNIAQIFQFAFAVTEQPTSRQKISVIKFNDERQFEVILNRNSSINVGIVNKSGQSSVLTFKGNFSDGYRHFFVAQFNENSATAIMLDSYRLDFRIIDSDIGNLDLLSATSLSFGEPLSNNSKTTQAAACYSNAVIDLQRGMAVRFTPFGYLENFGHDLHRLVTAYGVAKGGCPGFQVTDALPAYQNSADFPAWDTNFQRHVYRDGSFEDVTEDDFSMLWLFIIILTLVAVALLIVFIFLRCCKESNHRKPADYEAAEPLNMKPTNYRPPQPSPPPLVKQAQSHYGVPPPNIDFNRDFSPRTSVTSGLTGYFTAQEPPQTDDLDSDGDTTIRHIDDDDSDIVVVPRPQVLSSNMPQRMSSFRRDPTAPQDSPLYGVRDTPQHIFPATVPVPPPRLTSINQ